MPRVLLTGGSGFIAAHILDALLDHGHSVVTTVRSQDKAQKIVEAHPKYSKDRLDTVIVEDIAKEDAFEKAVISDPPFDIVIHTASPFHFNITDTKKDLLDPAIIGTTGILKAIKKSAPTVKRVVITSSFAAIINVTNPPNHPYSEADWNPVTEEEASKDASTGYRASKTLAEKAAWAFVEKEKPNFTLATCNPPLVFGPTIHYLNTLSAVNTSNQRIRDLITGASATYLPPTGTFLWIDVRDLALAHVLAAEKAEAGGKRFFVTAGYFSNRQAADIVADEFPELKGKIPRSEEALKDAGFPREDVLFGYDNRRIYTVLGLRLRGLRESVVDTARSLLEVAK